MTSLLRLIENESRLQLFELRQYWFETVLSLLAMTAIFVGLFYGLRLYGSNAFGGEKSLDHVLFGYILWIFASGAYSSANASINDDAQKGILEQLFLCPSGFRRLMVARSLAGLLMLMLTVVIMSYLAMWLTGTWVKINFVALLTLLLLGAPSLFGIGFVVSGLTLIFKRASTLGALLTLALVGLVALDGLPLNSLSALPFTPTVSLAKHVVFNTDPVSYIDVAVVVANSLAYFVLGLFVFGACESYAKRNNLIGIY